MIDRSRRRVQDKKREVPAIAPSKTVKRLIRQMGLVGALRGRKFKTTMPDTPGSKPADLAGRAFAATRPNELWVAA